MHRNSTRENRETPLPPAASKEAGRWEKAMSYKTHMYGGSSLQRGGGVQRCSTCEAAEQGRETVGGGCGGKAADRGEHGTV